MVSAGAAQQPKPVVLFSTPNFCLKSVWIVANAVNVVAMGRCQSKQRCGVGAMARSTGPA
jgi:hypothetical protein